MNTETHVTSRRYAGPAPRRAAWLALAFSALVSALADESSFAETPARDTQGSEPAVVTIKDEAAKISSIKSAAQRKQEAATLALLRAERAAVSGGAAEQADLLEARVAVRLARQETGAEVQADTAVSPEAEATRQQLWDEIAAARTPAERREASARYAEYRRFVQEQKTAAARKEDAK